MNFIDFITYRTLVLFSVILKLHYTIWEKEQVNGHSYMSPFDDPLAVLGINVNKTWDIDLFLIFNSCFHQSSFVIHKRSLVF